MTREMMLDFIHGDELNAVPASEKKTLGGLDPATYIGNADIQAKKILKIILNNS